MSNPTQCKAQKYTFINMSKCISFFYAGLASLEVIWKKYTRPDIVKDYGIFPKLGNQDRKQHLTFHAIKTHTHHIIQNVFC